MRVVTALVMSLALLCLTVRSGFAQPAAVSDAAADTPVADPGPSESVAGDSPADTPARATAQLSAGVGVGARDFAVPEGARLLSVDTGLFMVAELGVRLRYRVTDRVRVALLARYQTSLFHSIDEQQAGAVRNREVRVHRLDVGGASTLRLDGDGGVVLRLGLGYGVSDFRPAGDLLVPTFTLAGPYGRAGLRVSVFDGVEVTLAPEAQWILSVGQELRALGVAATGAAVGVEAAVMVEIGDVRVGATYRQRHAGLAGDAGGRFSDVARFATLRLEATL